ncbi:MAG: glycosyltransferase [bacterium]
MSSCAGRSVRVLHFINNENLSWYNMFLDTVRAQERRGHEVKVVVPPGGTNADRLEADGAEVIRLRVRSSKFDLWAARALSRIIRAEGAEIVHAHLTSSALLGSLAAGWAGTPCVASVLKITRKRHYMRCDRLLPCSDAVMESLLEQGVPAAMMRRVYTGIDFERFFAGFDPGENIRGQFGWGEGHRVAACIARLVPMKGHRHLVEAAALAAAAHPEVRFLLVGDGELRGALEAQAKRLGVGGIVHFAGTRTDLARILNSSDLSVLASVGKEGLPVAMVESALMKKPLVMTDVAGIREVVRDGGTGLLAPPGDARAFAAALIRMLEDPGAAERMALAAHEFVRREFNVDNTAAQMDEEYARAMGGGGGRRALRGGAARVRRGRVGAAVMRNCQ